MDKDVLKLLTLYLEKLDSLDTEERGIYLYYLKSLSRPIFTQEID